MHDCIVDVGVLVECCGCAVVYLPINLALVSSYFELVLLLKIACQVCRQDRLLQNSHNFFIVLR